MEALEEADLAGLFSVVQSTLGLRLESYRGRQLERRLAYFRQRHGLQSNAELAARLRADATMRQAFADFVTINVSEFFRNSDRFLELRDRVLPSLLAQGRPLQIWSAGCSIGAEVYSVALLLAQLDPSGRHRLLATDIDAGSLERCRLGLYQTAELREMPETVRRRFFRETPAGWELSPRIREPVEFRRHDLLIDPFPADQDLIICRNVVIYFTEAAKAALYRRFHAALRPGGVLFIGATESIFEAKAIGLQYMSPSFYTKRALREG